MNSSYEGRISGLIIFSGLYASSVREMIGVPVNNSTHLKSYMVSFNIFTIFVSLFLDKSAVALVALGYCTVVLARFPHAYKHSCYLT